MEPQASSLSVVDPEVGAASQVYSTREASEILGVSLRTVQLWVDGGILEAWKTAGGHRRVSRASVEALLKGGAPAARPADSSPAAATSPLLAYQPIFDKENRPFGYELLYRRGGIDAARIDDPVNATSRVIRVAFGELGFLGAIGDALCFINIEEEMLHEDILLALDPGKIVLELPADVVPDERMIERCYFLKRTGFRLLLENLRPDHDCERLLPLADFVKVDMRGGEDALHVAGRVASAACSAKLIAGRLETIEAYELARRLGYDYFQGFYFARPIVSRGRQISPQKMALLDLLRLLLSSDAVNAEIERRLKLDPALCLSLLRLVNSAAAGLSRRISTMREVLLMLGRQNLCRWIQVLLYASDDSLSGAPNPLMQLAAFRGRFLEYLVALLPGQAGLKDRAFMVGLLSLVDALLGVPLDQVLAQLNLTDDVEAALLRREGVLGGLLSLVEALDAGKFADADAVAEKLRLDTAYLRQGMVESLGWSNALSRGG
ncbi:MAG: helix-turn-helix domain-containing protein [Rhodocyclales bacterium]|nr:helix-turn-helix domain-containing protein [Rhodocyclales bacterium]